MYQILVNEIRKLQAKVIESNLIEPNELSQVNVKNYLHWKLQTRSVIHDDSSSQRKKKLNADQIFGSITIVLLCFMIAVIKLDAVDYLMSIRCFLPNNYMIWEMTRPISNCKYCAGIQRPIILRNITEEEFLVMIGETLQSFVSKGIEFLNIIIFSFSFPQKYEYFPQPIIIKNSTAHWPAREQLTFQFLKKLYSRNPDVLKTFNDECQFLPFKSNFASLKDFLDMPEKQVHSGDPSWYVGFGNCLPNILAELRELYPRPHFLPYDAETPNTDYTFLGYNEGAVMHVSLISLSFADIKSNRIVNHCLNWAA